MMPTINLHLLLLTMLMMIVMMRMMMMMMMMMMVMFAQGISYTFIASIMLAIM